MIAHTYTFIFNSLLFLLLLSGRPQKWSKMQHVKLNKPEAFPLFSLITLYVTDVLTRMYTSCPGTSITLSRTTIFTSAGATFWRFEVRITMLGLIINTFIVQFQGCGLRRILRSQKVPNHEILGVLYLNLYEKSKFFQSPKGKSKSPAAPRCF